MPEGLTEIGESAFEGCSHLSRITLPESLTKIGNKSFLLCGALSPVEMEITLPEGLTEIGSEAFYSCRLREITLPKSLKTLGSSVFNAIQMDKIYYEGTLDEWNNISKGKEAAYGITVHCADGNEFQVWE